MQCNPQIRQVLFDRQRLLVGYSDMLFSP